MRRSLLLLALLSLSAISAPLASASQQSQAIRSVAETYGLIASNANFVTGDTLAERTAAYQSLRRAGVRAIRLDINWAQVEPVGEPLHDYDFADRDREVRAITRAGLKVIGILAYGHPDYSALGGLVAQTPLPYGLPPFAALNQASFPADDPADFVRYARDTARHYEREFPGAVISWEVWNEENEGYRFWAPHEDPAAYARLLCETYPALKRVDAKTPILFGGVFFASIAGLPGLGGPEFLQAAYDAEPGLGDCYDVMAYHPYPYPFTAPEVDVPIRGSVLAARDAMERTLAANGDAGKPLWITEVGWPTHDATYGVPEVKQAEYAARMTLASFAQGIPVLTWYTYGDYADPTGANQEAWFGLFRPDGSAKPAYEALRTLSRTFRGTRFRRDRSEELGLPGGRALLGGRGFALEFIRRSGPHPARITALWLANESAGEGQGPGPGEGSLTPSSVQIQLPISRRGATKVGFLGGRGSLRPGVATLTLDSGPLYLIQPLRP